MTSRRVEPKYIGTWYITEMEAWNADYVNAVSRGHIRIDPDGCGFMQFCAAEAALDCRIEDIGGNRRLAFTFQGVDEGEPASGRGWCTVSGSEMAGRICFHWGEESSFTAAKDTQDQAPSDPTPKVIRLPLRTSAAGQGLEARVYSVEVLFKQHRAPLAQFAQDLNIVPELAPEIEEDSWGTRDSLEIWFQEIDGQKLTLHIQRAHFKHKEIYVRDLERFLGDIEALPYIQQAQIKKQ